MGKLEKQSASPPPGQIRHDDHSIGTLNASSYDTHGTPSTADDEMFFEVCHAEVTRTPRATYTSPPNKMLPCPP